MSLLFHRLPGLLWILWLIDLGGHCNLSKMSLVHSNELQLWTILFQHNSKHRKLSDGGSFGQNIIPLTKFRWTVSITCEQYWANVAQDYNQSSKLENSFTVHPRNIFNLLPLSNICFNLLLKGWLKLEQHWFHVGLTLCYLLILGRDSRVISSLSSPPVHSAECTKNCAWRLRGQGGSLGTDIRNWFFGLSSF